MKCAKCLTERPEIEMARVWVKDGWFPLCHPVNAVDHPTCFESYQRGHALYGEPVTVLKDRVPRG